MVWDNGIIWTDGRVPVGNIRTDKHKEQQQKGSHLKQEGHKIKG